MEHPGTHGASRSSSGFATPWIKCETAYKNNACVLPILRERLSLLGIKKERGEELYGEIKDSEDCKFVCPAADVMMGVIEHNSVHKATLQKRLLY